ncbi:MAG: hypothetical protein QOE12_3749 [Mycobacterium sp.]|jgi:uncharacterized RDD family membrane protein YckC|nr:hypothetical protein [Mycobacterium sp.]
MTGSNRPPESARESGDSGPSQEYPGQPLGLPEHGSGSLAGLGRRLAALLVDWLLAYGLAALGMTLGLISLPALSTAVLVIWLLLGVLSVRLFQFTPGQYALGLRVASVDQRLLVGLGRATARGVLIAFVIPALFVDVDGRGIQDRVTGTAVVRR